ADLVWGTAASSLLILEERGMLEPYAPAGLERVMPQFKDTANPPSWVGINAWEAAFVLNKKEAEARNLPPVSSYQDLLKPEFRGQIIMSNPSSSGTGFLFVSGLIQSMGEAAAFAYLDELHQNIAMYTHSGSAPARRAGEGEFSLGISFGYAGVAQLNRGFPVDLIFPVEGSGWDVEANALIKRSEIKDAAKKFLDWAISLEKMDMLKDDYAITSIRVSDVIPGGYIKDPVSQLLPNDLKWAASNRERILEEWSRRYDGKTESR
ncbi:MAG: extracellular solute-binding protein, partial [Treponema sp.]|nr:extracellular solute-binding protein [Treponema sp.]